MGFLDIDNTTKSYGAVEVLQRTAYLAGKASGFAALDQRPRNQGGIAIASYCRGR